METGGNMKQTLLKIKRLFRTPAVRRPDRIIIIELLEISVNIQDRHRRDYVDIETKRNGWYRSRNRI